MPRVACNRQNPHLVVPHLIVRTPLPAGTEVVRRTEIDRVEDLIACNRSRIEALEAWKITIDASIVSIWERINTVIEPYLVPAGAIVMWPATSVPAGWLVCDGSLLVRTEHATLFSKIGTSFNTGGEAVTEFRLPNFEKKFVRGWESGVWGADANLFDAMTAAPVDVASISTLSGGSGSHNHGLGSGWGTDTVANHNHPVIINSANASHIHPDHQHSIADGGSHYHDMQTIYDPANPPVSRLTAPAGSHFHNLPVKYLSVEVEQAGEGTRYLWDDIEGTEEYNPSVNTVSDHQHVLPPTDDVADHNHGGSTGLASGASATANHLHTGSSSGAGSHDHSITKPSNTDDATVNAHSHVVDKLTGWDDETRPEGIWMNFIIKR